MYARQRTVNPLLGVYYGIFTAVFIGLVVFLLILEHMKIIDEYILYALTGAAFVLSVVISLATMTNQSEDFYVSGRRVPAGLNGFVLFVLSVGGAGLSGITGAIFFLGVDGYGLLFGLLGGLLISGFFLASFIRKSGVYTLPSFFEVRFRSRFVGFLTALALVAPVVLFAFAELSFLKFMGPLVFGLSSEFTLLIVLVLALSVLLPGGVRSMGWAQCALAIVVLLGLIIPLIIVSLKLTNLPLAQMTYGSLIDEISNFQGLSGDRLSSDQGEAEITQWASLLKNEVQALSIPFIGGERALTGLEKVFMMIVIAFGVAAMPSVLLRSTMTLTVFQARKSFAWAVALVGLIVLSIPACAIFLQYMIFNPEAKFLVGDLPDWVEQLEALGLLSAKDINNDGQIVGSEFLFSRDVGLLGLPVVAGLNGTMQSLSFAALMAAAMASFVGRLMTLSKLLSRDLHFQKSEMEADVVGLSNLLWTRLMIVLVTLSLLMGAIYIDISGFALFLSGLVLCACSVFPVLILSIWWNRMTKFGYIFGLVTGLVGGCVALYLTKFGLNSDVLGVGLFECAIGVILISFVCTVVGAFLGPKPNGADMEVLLDIRTPGGEALYDRLLRLAMPRRTTGGV